MDSQLALDLGGSASPDGGGDAVRVETTGSLELPALLSSLAAEARRDAMQRKRLVARTRGEGRELLRALSRMGVGWVGFEPTTLASLALEVSGSTLAQDGLLRIDAFGIGAHIDRAIDEVLVGKKGRFEELSEAVGFRRALEQSVLDLRLAGLSPEVLRRTPFDDAAKRQTIARVLELYEQALEDSNEVDSAGVLALATERLSAVGRGALPAEESVLLAPGLPARGRAKRFIEALLANGARFLTDDPVRGLEPPTGLFLGRAGADTPRAFVAQPGASSGGRGAALGIELFGATTVTAELREVLRRVVTRGIPWDQVEILTPDPAIYGSALHAIASALDVPVTFGVGLAVERTRPGRALVEYFRWIDSGFSADVIRGLLEAGDLRPTPSYAGLSPMELARRFRELRIGWGRSRHERRLERRIRSLDRMTATRRESASQMEVRRRRLRMELEALDSILSPVLAALPTGVPDPSESPLVGQVSAAELARGAAEFLLHVPPRDSVDESAASTLQDILRRIEESWHRPTNYRAAAAIVRRALQVRVPAPRSDGRAPWGSTPGHVYFTDLEYGGLSNRRHTYIVGMDAGRFPGPGLQDPLLLDRERAKLSPKDLPMSGERLAERAFAFYRAVSRSRGALTVSYATWEPAEAREMAPSVEALATLRLIHGDATLTFERMRDLMGRPVGAIPTDDTMLDGRDVVLSAMEKGGRLLDGRGLVEALYPGVAAGSRAQAAATTPEPSAHMGLVQPRPELDPRDRADVVLSASRLQDLGACPRRYLYGSVLKLRPPDDPDYRPDRWLSPLARGDVLHRVFEATLRRARAEPDTPLETLAFKELKRHVERATELHPTPSREILNREIRSLREDVRSFLRLLDHRGAAWEELELKFGFDEVEAATIRLHPSGTIRLRGAIDRLDSDPTVVIDYKTGSAYDADRDTGLFHGGRRLQNVLYTMAVHDLLKRPVQRMEYQYATRRAKNSVLEFDVEDLRTGPFLLHRMLDGAAAGHFLPTEEPDDCRWCDFRAVCRVRTSGSGLVSPAAEWSKRWFKQATDEPNSLPAALRELRDVRREDAPGMVPPPLWPGVPSEGATT